MRGGEEQGRTDRLAGRQIFLLGPLRHWPDALTSYVASYVEDYAVVRICSLNNHLHSSTWNVYHIHNIIILLSGINMTSPFSR